MFTRISFFLALFSFFTPLLSHEKTLSIVIIGGGPAGLGAAIEAKATGADVVVIEKRECYLRKQSVFLMEPALNLLDRWEVSIPEMIVGSEGREKVGAMRIKDLEIALAKRVHELGIPIILGEFQDLKEGRAVISRPGGEIELPYDLLIGADGTHSSVRKSIHVSSSLFGSALGSIVLIPFPENNQNLEFISPFRCGQLFLTKIIIPSATIISAQGKEVSKEMIISAAIDCGWLKEAALLSSDKSRYVHNIEILLQQANFFSDSKQSVILLGDAAASASFLQGMGANCALETVMIAGQLFKTKQQESDYSHFDQAMQEITDRLIHDSLFLVND